MATPLLQIGLCRSPTPLSPSVFSVMWPSTQSTHPLIYRHALPLSLPPSLILLTDIDVLLGGGYHESRDVPQFIVHVNFLDKHIKLTREGPTHTEQYLRFDSYHHPLEDKLGVIRRLQHRANTVPARHNSQGRRRTTYQRGPE